VRARRKHIDFLQDIADNLEKAERFVEGMKLVSSSGNRIPMPRPPFPTASSDTPPAYCVLHEESWNRDPSQGSP
jgi:hypothetical protein